MTRSMIPRVGILALLGAVAGACGGGDADEQSMEATGAVTVPAPSEISIPPGGLAGGRGSAGQNTPEISLDSITPAREGSAVPADSNIPNRDVPPVTGANP